MALMPKRVKYRKSQRGRRKGWSTGGNKLNFGEFGLKVLENGWISDRQIEAARVALTRQVRGMGKLWVRMFPDKAATKKPAETRMGKGKGMPDHWICVVRRGRILFEIEGVPEPIAREAMRVAAYKLPLSSKFVSRKLHG